MTYRTLKWITILLPTFVIGGFEFIRHHFLLPYLSMETGNLYITILTFVLSFLFGNWMFRKIEEMNQRILAERAELAVYEDRERIARELHDHLAQTLFFLNVNLKRGNLSEASVAVSEMDHHLRQAIFNLRTNPVESISLAKRLRKWLMEWNTVTGIEVKETLGQLNGYFTPSEEIILFSILQEAFMNIRKHAYRASLAQVEFIQEKDEWKLIIQDNGLKKQFQKHEAERFGMRMMKEQVGKLGASLEMQKRPAGGTLLLIRGKRK